MAPRLQGKQTSCTYHFVRCSGPGIHMAAIRTGGEPNDGRHRCMHCERAWITPRSDVRSRLASHGCCMVTQRGFHAMDPIWINMLVTLSNDSTSSGSISSDFISITPRPSISINRPVPRPASSIYIAIPNPCGRTATAVGSDPTAGGSQYTVTNTK
jgi:hypothetical protein